MGQYFVSSKYLAEFIQKKRLTIPNNYTDSSYIDISLYKMHLAKTF